jgi:hypothetical protein
VLLHQHEAIQVIDGLDFETEELLVMKAKILYTRSNFDACIAAAKKAIELSGDNYDAHYILASSYVACNMLVK